MKQIVILLALTLLAGCQTNRKAAGNPAPLHIAICGDDKIQILNADASTDDHPAVAWQWQATTDAPGLPPEFIPHLQSIDDCKPVNNHTQILATSSSGCVLLIDISTRLTLYAAHAPNAHSADLLPRGRIAVALSTHPQGNRLAIYSLHQPDTILYSDTLYSAHGAVWNPQLQRLYALGYDQLREYALQDWDTPHPSLRLLRRWPLPLESGHDLTPITDHTLLITGHQGAATFHIPTAAFRPYPPLASTPDVKSANHLPATGRLIYTVAEESWWTDHVYLHNPPQRITIPNLKLYKARPINFNHN
ncbi:MAG: DUF6528 family protein [Tannerella sp.]|jgi:hypothetical protein|nr:DUF6528 family protein [Tannerella sp.]